MRYCGPMRYAMQFPAHQLGGPMELCIIRGYALSEVCVMRGSTVFTFFEIQGYGERVGLAMCTSDPMLRLVMDPEVDRFCQVSGVRF